jgi:N-acetyl-gamma-glutamyl-phosphate reductase
MNKKFDIGIIGGAGFTGGELIRLLLNHESVEIRFVQSRSQQGKFLYEVHTDLQGETELRFTSDISQVDLLFLCLPHGESRNWINENKIHSSTKIIDLGNDFRVNSSTGKMEFVYGLPELNKEKIIQANYIANPGCFATAIQLGLLPVINEEIKEIYSVGITGSTGAGQTLQDTINFNWRNNNVSAYKTLTHQHMDEIGKTFSQINNTPPVINFVPWRGNFTRGIFVSSILSCDKTLPELTNMYHSFYSDSEFVFVSDKAVDVKQVINTNKCMIHLEKQKNKLVVHTAIDNLLKGASGQAVQNMNLILGLTEVQGLKLKSIAF